MNKVKVHVEYGKDARCVACVDRGVLTKKPCARFRLGKSTDSPVIFCAEHLKLFAEILTRMADIDKFANDKGW